MTSTHIPHSILSHSLSASNPLSLHVIHPCRSQACDVQSFTSNASAAPACGAAAASLLSPKCFRLNLLPKCCTSAPQTFLFLKAARSRFAHLHHTISTPHNAPFSMKPPKQSSVPCSSAKRPLAHTPRFQTQRAQQVSRSVFDFPKPSYHAFPRRGSITCKLLLKIHVGFPVIFFHSQPRSRVLGSLRSPARSGRLRPRCRFGLQRNNGCTRPRIRVQQQELCRLRSLCCGVIERMRRPPVLRPSHGRRKSFHPHPTPSYHDNRVRASVV